MEELQQYSHSGMPVDVTISVREIRAFMMFCEAMDVDLKMYFEKAGSPVLFSPFLGNSDQSERWDFDAMLIVASMVESQIKEGSSSQRKSSQVNRSQSRGTEEMGPVWDSGGTRVWSDLSASRVNESEVGGRDLSQSNQRPRLNPELNPREDLNANQNLSQGLHSASRKPDQIHQAGIGAGPEADFQGNTESAGVETARNHTPTFFPLARNVMSSGAVTTMEETEANHNHSHTEEFRSGQQRIRRVRPPESE